jgi:hypothetical protein
LAAMMRRKLNFLSDSDSEDAGPASAEGAIVPISRADALRVEVRRFALRFKEWAEK